MAHTLASETKTSMNVFKLKIRMLIENLFWSHSIGQQLQNIAHSNSHSSNTGPPATLLRVHSDSIKYLRHKLTS